MLYEKTYACKTFLFGNPSSPLKYSHNNLDVFFEYNVPI